MALCQFPGFDIVPHVRCNHHCLKPTSIYNYAQITTALRERKERERGPQLLIPLLQVLSVNALFTLLGL